MAPSHQEDLVHPMILFLLPVARDDFKNKDDNQNYKKMHLHFLLITRIRNGSRARSMKFAPHRLNWTDYLTQLVQQNEFAATLRMSLLSFNKLAETLRVKLQVDADQSQRSCKKSGPFLPELMIAMSLRSLAGGQWLDIKKVLYKVSKSHFYSLRNKFMNAVVTCAALEIRLPDASDIMTLQLLALQFEGNASVPVFRGCVGALDGMTVFIKAPTAAEAKNVLAYYSGHYESFCTLQLLLLGAFPIRRLSD